MCPEEPSNIEAVLISGQTRTCQHASGPPFLLPLQYPGLPTAVHSREPGSACPAHWGPLNKSELQLEGFWQL